MSEATKIKRLGDDLQVGDLVELEEKPEKFWPRGTVFLDRKTGQTYTVLSPEDGWQVLRAVDQNGGVSALSATGKYPVLELIWLPEPLETQPTFRAAVRSAVELYLGDEPQREILDRAMRRTGLKLGFGEDMESFENAIASELQELKQAFAAKRDAEDRRNDPANAEDPELLKIDILAIKEGTTLQDVKDFLSDDETIKVLESSYSGGIADLCSSENGDVSRILVGEGIDLVKSVFENGSMEIMVYANTERSSYLHEMVVAYVPFTFVNG